jgi:outer membrane receptor protein involved in Fe transport
LDASAGLNQKRAGDSHCRWARDADIDLHRFKTAVKASPSQVQRSPMETPLPLALPLRLCPHGAVAVALLSWLATASFTAAQGTAVSADGPVRLAVFEVGADKDEGYAASTAMTGTRTNEKLENLPNSISIMTQEFIEDLAFNNYFDAVEFATGAENIVNGLGTVGAPISDQTSGSQVSIRGLASVRQLRDGFPWYVVSDVFNTERLEFSRGPGGLAYGDVDAGGIINIATKRAGFQRKGKVQARFDSFGTQRFSIDANEAIPSARLGLRVNAINSQVRGWRERFGRDLEAYAGAARWEPFKDRRTQIDVLYERGNNTAHLGHLQLTDGRIAYIPGTGTAALDADPNRPGVQLHGVGMQQAAVAGNVHALVDIGGTIYNLQTTPQNVFRVSNTVEGANAVSATDPQNPNRYPLITIPSSLISKRQNWGGPDQKHPTKYHAYTIELKHSVSDRLNLLVAHNGQFDETKRKQSTSNLGSFIAGRAVRIDVNPVLPNPNGSGTIPNPNFEQIYVSHLPYLRPDGHEIQNWRGQAVYDARLPRGITQRVVLGASYRHEDYYIGNFSYGLAPQEIARRGWTGAAALYTNNLIYPVHYLRDGNSDEKLGWNPRPGITHLFRNNAALNRQLEQSLTSGAANILGSYFNGRVRSSIGVSREHWVQKASLPLRASLTTGEQHFVAADGSLIPNNGVEKVEAPLFPAADDWSTNQTYGAVWHALPWVSLTAGYFESSQFSDNYGLDLNGNARAPLTGEGTDYSVRFHLLGGKIEASATWFETTQENLSAAINANVQNELNALLSQPLVNNTDYRDRTATGWEYQVLTNLTRNWTLIGSYSRNRTEFTRFFPLLESKVAEVRAAAQAGGRNPDDATTLTREFLEDQEGNISSTTRITAAITTRYTFREGRFKGVTGGVAARFAKGIPWVPITVGGVAVLPATVTEDYWLVNPFVAYRRKIGRYPCTFQLNINNLLDNQSNQGVNWRFPRYLDPRQFVYTATIAY